MDYKKAGVDIEAGYKSVELMKKYVKETMRPEVMGGIGGFSGAFSLSAIKDMEFDDVSEAIPAYLALIMMPLTYSIANGIAVGLIAVEVTAVVVTSVGTMAECTTLVGDMAVSLICGGLWVASHPVTSAVRSSTLIS